MSNKLFIGCDPDLHKFSAAGINEKGELIFVALVKLKTVKGSRAGEASARMITQGLPKFLQWYEANVRGIDTYAIAVEGQNVVYTANKGAKPQDMVELASVAGASLHALSTVCQHPDDTMFLFPKPSEWKGSVPKHIHQCRLLKKQGVTYTMKGGKSPYPVPDLSIMEDVKHGPDKINDGDWQDITDSIGLAHYAKEKYEAQERRNAR